jgi:nucleotide-binding universal stress UspA family protein
MKDMKKILVPIDGSKKSFDALDRAVILAGFTNGEVTCLNVIPHVEEGGGPRTRRYDEIIESQAQSILNKAEKFVDKKNVKFRKKILRGSPGIEILKVAKTGKYDHIIMSATGAGSANGDMIGSVSNFILQKSKIPVYLIK